MTSAITVKQVAISESVTTHTVRRWILVGVGGVKLEARRSGGSWRTTWEALRRFNQLVTESAGVGVTTEPTETPTQRQRRIDKATEKLESLKW